MKPLLLRKVLLTLLLCGAALIVPACSRNDAAPQAVQGAAKAAPAALPAAASHWYFFSTDTDGSVRLQGFRPWTEAVRIADCTSTAAGALFLINKCGVYPREKLNPDTQLLVQHPLFTLATAAGIYTINGLPFIRIYQDSAFLPPNKVTNVTFLLRYNMAAASCTPAADIGALRLPENAQCKLLLNIQNVWYAGFKADNGTDISFTYMRCNDFSVFTQSDAYQHCEQISAEVFRTACEPRAYNKMPSMVAALANTLQNSRDVYIHLRSDTDKEMHSEVFAKLAQTDADTARKEPPLNVYAVLYKDTGGKVCASLLLPDGTLLIGTDSQHYQKLRLPSLPENFNYTSFLISDTEITAAWEENMFYSVGRTGIFTAAVADLRHL